jgi:hypothetical protein
MPLLAAILIFIAVLGGAFYWLYRRPSRALPTPRQFQSYADSDGQRYRHICRLFSQEDFDFLGRTERGQRLQPILRRERCRLLRQILAELRMEFESLVAVGSMLATSSPAQDSNFSGLLVRETVRFYSAYAWLWLYSYSPTAGPGGEPAGILVDQVRDLRQGTRQLMAALTPRDMDRLRQTILGHP